MIGLVLVVVGAAWASGLFARVGEPKILARELVAMGGWGYFAFIAVFTVLQPFGLPGIVLVVAAPLIWPWKTAFALSMTGAMAASLVGFTFARFLARDWVAARIPTRLRRYDEALERHAFKTVVVLRFILWMPQLLHAFFGVSKVRFSTHFWGSLLGYTVPLLLASYLGSKLFDESGALQPEVWPILGGVILVVLTVAAVVYLRRRRRPQ
jgi:uncharacterized membrane protein YdjX (TVP38/TMEM64 family)